MDAVQAKPGVTDRADFAQNQLVIITPARQPGRHRRRSRTSRNPGVKLVLAAEGVPVGDYARESPDERRILDARDGEHRLQRRGRRERRREGRRRARRTPASSTPPMSPRRHDIERAS